MTELSPWLPLGTALFSLGLVSVLSSYKAIHSLHSIRLNQASQAATWSLSLLLMLSLWVGFDSQGEIVDWAIAFGGTFVFGLFAQRCPSEFTFWSKKRARYIYLLLFFGAFVTTILVGMKASALLTLQIMVIAMVAARNHRLAVNGIQSDLQISQSKLLTHIARKNQQSLQIHASKIVTTEAGINLMTKADAS